MEDIVYYLFCMYIIFFFPSKEWSFHFNRRCTVDCFPYRIRALGEFLAYAKSFDGVWFPTREEIATWYLENHQDHI